ncbi:G2/M phase-specific E3 ubiquitin-protein ligase-like [Amphiprion ocellaris]|uniref:G2/M phase-specific E3 ubiquitin-protein ligase-like n=1 Tax=Amphiprion ocellaris TaxID=80972 RepID=UPI002411831F|nr:G2/M phase-specific E3 ubiquitin-protein ligase-like [Amphiprion ocellaris]
MCGQELPLEQSDRHVLPDPDVQSKVKRVLNDYLQTAFYFYEKKNKKKGQSGTVVALFSFMFLSKIQQCKTTEDLTTLQQDLGDWISECGIPGIFSATAEDIPKIYAYVVKHYIFLRTARMIHQFTEGMNVFGKLWNLVKKNWIAFLPLFTNMQEPLSKEAFKAILTYNYSSRGTNHRKAEEDTIYSWEMVLNMIEDKMTDMRFEDLLVFITGADEVPALGFRSKLCIDFYEQAEGMRCLPYASTCMKCLYLPRGVTQEEELHQMLYQAIGESLGFGKV